METLSKEDKELFNFIINDPQSTEEEKKSAREVLEKFGGEKTTSTKKASPKKTTAKKVVAKKTTTKSKTSDLEKKKAEIKKRTGKTLEECEKIIEQYKALKSSDATQKKKATTQKVQAKKRTTKLKKEGKVIQGTTEKNSEATLNTATKKVVQKLDKEVNKIQKTSKTEKQVEKKIDSLVTKAVRSNKKLFTDTAKELAKVDKTNAKEYLLSLKKEIDTLLKKYEYGGMLPSNFGQAGLVGETGTMNEVDLFAMGGTLPQGVHQYYANTYNPAYPTPHGYAKGGSIPQSAKDEFYQLREDDMDFADQYGEDDLQEWYEEQGRFAKGGEIDTISELYEVEKYDQYPYARDLVAHFIYGDDERGNLIVDATNGRYTKQLADYSELSDLMMQYENTWKYEGNMEYIDRQVRDYFSEIDIIDYYAKGGYIVEDGKVMLNGNKIGSYQFDRDSNSFWIYDGVKDRNFEEKEDIIDYFENRNFAKGGEVADLKKRVSELDTEENTRVGYDGMVSVFKNEYYWEDFENGERRDGFKTEKDALQSLVEYLTYPADAKLISVAELKRQNPYRMYELPSVGSVLDVQKALIYPQYDNGNVDLSNPISLLVDEVSSDWYESLSREENHLVERSLKYNTNEKLEEEKKEELSKIKNWKTIKEKKLPNGLVIYTHSISKDRDGNEVYRNSLVRVKDDVVKYSDYFTKKDIAENEFNLYRGYRNVYENRKTRGYDFKKEEFAKGGMTENKAHYSINQDGQIFVDSNFINMCQSVLPNSKLKHYGFGEFYLETPNGNVNFIRTDFKIKGFVGRTHRLGGNPNVGLDLLDAMKSKSQQVSGERFAKGGMTGNKNSQIIAEIEEIQSEITERPPKVYEREGQIKLSSEEGDEFSDYYGEFYEPMYVDARLEAIADKYNSYWDWENAGTLVLVEEFAKGGNVYSLVDGFDETTQDYDQVYYKTDDYNELINYVADLKNDREYSSDMTIIEVMPSGKMRKFDASMFAKGGYIAKYQGKSLDVQAKSLYEAKQKAIKELKVPKSKQGILAIMSKDAYDNEEFRFMAKGGKTQGYNDKLDESLGNTKGKRSAKKQNYKDRRNESESMEKKGGKRKYARVKTMDKGTRKKRKTPMTLAKAIRRDGEKWQDAVKRATMMMKKEK